MIQWGWLRGQTTMLKPNLSVTSAKFGILAKNKCGIGNTMSVEEKAISFLSRWIWIVLNHCNYQHENFPVLRFVFLLLQQQQRNSHGCLRWSQSWHSAYLCPQGHPPIITKLNSDENMQQEECNLRYELTFDQGTNWFILFPTQQMKWENWPWSILMYFYWLYRTCKLST